MSQTVTWMKLKRPGQPLLCTLLCVIRSACVVCYKASDPYHMVCEETSLRLRTPIHPEPPGRDLVSGWPKSFNLQHCLVVELDNGCE